MFKKHRSFTVAGIFLLFCFTGSALQAQALHSKKEKQKPGLINPKLAEKAFSVPSVFKSKADNDISGWVEQYYTSEEWVDDYRAEYEYSTDRLEITQHMFYFDGENWEEDESTSIRFNAEGYPLEVSYSIFGSEINQIFYYSPEGRLDSAKYWESDGEGSFYEEKIELDYITPDSIELTNIYEDDGGEIVSELGGYFLNKGGNFIEVYYGEEFDEVLYDDRYTYYNASFDEFLRGAFDEFFFKEVYNDEYYHDSEMWIPFSRTTNTEESGKVTEILEEYYYEDDESWYEEYRSLITYDDQDRVDIIAEESLFGEQWSSDYRTVYSYGAVTSSESDGLVSGYTLSQNYPNPFNPSTQISYSIPAASEVLMEVYNVLGRKVTTLVEGRRNAGTHVVTFDASRLPSGIYYYKLQSDSYVEIRAMTFIK